MIEKSWTKRRVNMLVLDGLRNFDKNKFWIWKYIVQVKIGIFGKKDFSLLYIR